MTTASATRAHLPTRVPCIIAGAGRAANGYEYTVESLHDLLRHLTLNPKVFKGRGDVRETARRGHRSLAELAGILVKESLQYRPMEQNLVGELVLHPAMARVLESAAEDGQELRLEVEGTPELVPGTKKVKGWRHISSVNLLAPQGLDWLDRVREADSDGSDDSELQEWRWQVQSRLSGRPVREHDAPQEGSMDRDPRVGDLPPGTYPVVDFQDGEPRESLMRRGFYDMAAAGLVPTHDRMGPLAVQRGRQVAPSTTGAVREAASTGPTPRRHSMATQSTPQSLQQALAAAQEGTGLMLSEDHINLRERASQHYPDNYAVKSDADVAVHESVASGIWDYNLDASLGARARQPLDTASVRETGVPRGSGRPAYVDPNNPASSYPDLQASLDVARKGTAQLFGQPGQRGAGAQQGSTAGQALEDAVGQSLFGRTH